MASEAVPWPVFQPDDLKHVWAYLRATAGK
jgi:hypothetical protein